MTTTAAEALELALWLHRAPARRAALLGRPLPAGIGQLLRVAGGARDQVMAAATITGEDEATVLEAVRFYLQQILFHEEADAYRVLGLHREDSHQRAREHHRLLQQWLHPDRSGDEAWESVYATRINQAWAHLRTPQARAGYDATLAAAPQDNRSRFSGEPVPDTPPARIPAAHPPVTRSRNLTLVVILGCVGLLALIALRPETPPQWPGAGPSLAGTGATPSTQEVDPLMALGAALTQAMSAPEEAPVSPVAVPPLVPPVPAKPKVDPAPVTVAPDRSQLAQVASASLTIPAREQASLNEPATGPMAVLLPPAPMAMVAPVGPSVALPVSAAVDVATLVPAPVQVPDAFGRMSQAQDRTRAVLAFLGNPSAGAPPVWNDLATMQHAQQLRTALLARGADGRGTAVELEAPRWRLYAQGARLESRYRCGAEQGDLDLAFTWREDQLLVSGISLDPDA